MVLYLYVRLVADLQAHDSSFELCTPGAAVFEGHSHMQQYPNTHRVVVVIYTDAPDPKSWAGDIMHQLDYKLH